MRTLALAFTLLVGCNPGVSFPPDAAWPAGATPPWAHQERLLLSNNAQDTLAAVSRELPQPRLLGFGVIGDNPVELEGPHHIAAMPDGQSVFVNLSNYVPGSGSGPHGSHGTGTVPGTLVRLRSSDFSVLGEAQVDRNPGDVILSPDGKTAYVSHYDIARLTDQVTRGLPEAQGYSAIAVVDTTQMGRPPLYPVCATAHGLVLSADGGTLYTVCGLTDQLAVMDLATHAVKRVFVGPSAGAPLNPRYQPYAVMRSPADGSLWISCNATGELRVFDPKTGAMDDARTVFVNGVPLFGAFRSDGKTLLVPHQGDDKVSIVDTAAAKELATIALPAQACLNAHVLTLMPDDRTAYVVCEGDHKTRQGSLVALDVDARVVTGFVEAGLFPDGVVRVPAAP